MCQEQKPFPVIIAGAGPCGLVAALVLQMEGFPFVIIERATREKLYSDVGSGFDIAPTAIDILQNRLKLNVQEMFQGYAGMHLQTMHGKTLREANLKDLNISFDYCMATRADMQRTLLDALLSRTTRKEETNILRCGVELKRYEQNNNEDTVTVTLSDGSTIIGSTLLGCDGINSAVRRQMFSEEEDNLHFCKTTCWWGKMEMNDELQIAIDKTQKFKSKGTSFIWSIGDHDYPGSFMGVPTKNNQFGWVFFTKTDTPPSKRSNDLTRRGGVTLNDEDKKELEKLIAERDDLIQQVVAATPASSITKVGLFDREDLEKTYVRGRVALLGDAAHPQSPFMGQGVNMAITDAYVCATRLARLPRTALSEYNSTTRRKAVNKVLKQARSYGDMSVTKKRLTCWMFRTAVRCSPLSWIANDMLNGDQGNSDFVRALDIHLQEVN